MSNERTERGTTINKVVLEDTKQQMKDHPEECGFERIFAHCKRPIVYVVDIS